MRWPLQGLYCLLFLLDSVPDHVADKQGSEGEERDGQFGIVLFDDILLAVGEVTEACQDAVPNGGAQEGVKCKGQQLHVGNTCRNRNQLTNHRDQAAHESRDGSVFAEVVLGLFEFLRVEQQEMSQTAIGELVDDGAAQELGEEVVDVGSYECACTGGDYN